MTMLLEFRDEAQGLGGDDVSMLIAEDREYTCQIGRDEEHRILAEAIGRVGLLELV